GRGRVRGIGRLRRGRRRRGRSVRGGVQSGGEGACPHAQQHEDDADEEQDAAVALHPSHDPWELDLRERRLGRPLPALLPSSIASFSTVVPTQEASVASDRSMRPSVRLTVAIDGRMREGDDSRPIEQWYPRQDSNLRPWLRRPVLYPLSYGGV